MSMGIRAIGGYIGDKVANGIAAATNLKAAKKLMGKFDGDLEKALAYAVVGSIIAKDGIGCAMYVTQSMNNKKILCYIKRDNTFAKDLSQTERVIACVTTCGDITISAAWTCLFRQMHIADISRKSSLCCPDSSHFQCMHQLILSLMISQLH